VFFNSTTDRLVGTRDNTSLIDSFTVRANGPAGRCTRIPIRGTEPRADRR
jgi:hypothetical protein